MGPNVVGAVSRFRYRLRKVVYETTGVMSAALRMDPYMPMLSLRYLNFAYHCSGVRSIVVKT